MKKLLILGILMVFAFVACDLDDDNDTNRLVSVGTIVKEGSDPFTIKLDNGNHMTLVNTYTDNDLTDGDRVLVEYEITLTKENDEIDAKVYDIDEILTKGVIQLTEENKDSIGNDPIHIHLDDIWFSEKHLNFIFEYYGYNRTHYINLVKPIGNPLTNDGKVILEFRHNANDDYPSRILRGIVSFEMESLKVADETKIDFVVRFTDFGSEEYEWEGSYTFNTSAQSKSLEISDKEFVDLKSSVLK